MLLRTLRAVLTAMVAAVLLAGCTGRDAAPSPRPDPEVTESSAPSPSPSVTATPTSEPVVVPPEAPPELERTDEVGAAAAAEYFLGLYGYTMQTGDVVAWDKMSADGCGFCASTRAVALEIASRGEVFSGGAIIPITTSVLSRDDLLEGYPVDLRIEQAPSAHLDPNGQILAESRSRLGTVRVDVLAAADGWKILAVVSEEA